MHWDIFQAISTRTAIFIGSFKGSLEYAVFIQKRANALWKSKHKRHREDRFKVLLCNGIIRQFDIGW
jgi:hypothetical protein